MALMIHTGFAFAQGSKTEIASSPNPIGSGARAIGMGGAFIAVADDATAASWNPGGLFQLKKPEISFVVNGFHRVEDNTFENNPEANGSQSVSEWDINYFSAAYPFKFLDRNMVVSLNYQQLYDFTREWEQRNSLDTPEFKMDMKTDYEQSGGLSALGLAYCVQIVPELSFGFTLNFWDDDLSRNKWKKNIHTSITQTISPPDMETGPPGLPPGTEAGIPSEIKIWEENDWIDEYSFSGFNANIGLLWRAGDKLSIGMVFKSPFTAELGHEGSFTIRTSDFIGDQVGHYEIPHNEEMDMPMSYGVGLAYRFSDQFTLSADIYRTEWNDFIIRSEWDDPITGASIREEISPVTNKPQDNSDVDATHQIRIGTEYLFLNPQSNYVIPLRGGMFYDPAPAEGSPNDIYRFSLGSGLSTERYAFDVAFQYRFGNDADAHVIPEDRDDSDSDITPSVVPYSFSQDLDEYIIYSSLIIYF